jgi:hypothetical protein
MTTNPSITASEMGRRGTGLAKVRGNHKFYAGLAKKRWKKARRIRREQKRNSTPLTNANTPK